MLPDGIFVRPETLGKSGIDDRDWRRFAGSVLR